ncbi:helix-turn-helix domain-containing protein [uncultured Maribacter sp.]|uniref:hybrid sensor histidine kinase/response regulator transcription factor n=1 Tax=uncultured Maribacter sp. TaxID=431308 RepID=UPI002607D219|nr:helix-turn-helix domain-containing protein [uncultured Maribacter sp.]
MQNKITYTILFKTKKWNSTASIIAAGLLLLLFCTPVLANEVKNNLRASKVFPWEINHETDIESFSFIKEIKNNNSQPLLNTSLYSISTKKALKKDTPIKAQLSEQDNTIWFAMPKTLASKTHSPYGTKGWPFIFMGTFLLSLLLISKYNHQLRINERNLFKVHEANNEINRLKLHFYTTLTHDFKSPLTNILDPIQDLLSSKNNDVFVQTKLKYIEHNVKQLLGVVNQLTDYRKIEIEESKLVLAKTNIIDFLRDTINTNQILASTKKIQVTFKSKLLSREIWFDVAKMESAMNTILTNAINTAANNSEIVISTIIPEDSLTVVKEGKEFNCKHILIKIALPNINKNLGSSTHTSLATKRNNNNQLQENIESVEEILKIHFGNISITQYGYDIQLPIDNIHFYSTNSSQIIPKGANTKQISITDEEEKQTISITPSVLVSDNDTDIRNQIKNELSSDYRILEAENNKDALNIALKEIPNLIIGDVSTEETSGIELCSQLKNNVRTSHIPIILLSSLNSVENRIEGFESGADAYIPKPFKMKLLRLRVDKLVESRTKIHRHFTTQEHITLDQITLNSNDQKFLNNIKDILEKHLENEAYSVDQLAIDMNISRSTLFRKLKHLTGHAPNEFIRTIRLKRAANLLAQNQLSVSEISYLVGFNDPNYFGKCFRKMFGDSPSTFASKYKNLKESGIKDFFLPN